MTTWKKGHHINNEKILVLEMIFSHLANSTPAIFIIFRRDY
jgi:hypothetical protein